MHADHSEAVVDETPSLGTETDPAVAEKATYRILEHPKYAFRTRPVPPEETPADDLAESEAEDDQAGWVTAFFGPASARRNLWLFVGSTGIVGLILALILLFSGNPPQEARIPARQESAQQPDDEPEETPAAEEPVEVTVETTIVHEEPEPEEPPFVEVDPEPAPEPPLTEDDPEPEPPVVAEVTPEPEPAADDIGVEVIILPAPDPHQGEQFEVTAGDEPLDPDAGFEDLARNDWQQADLLERKLVDAWSELQQLVPLKPYGPQESVTPPAVTQRRFTASFESTQPRRAGQSLLMPYELTLTNTGSSVLERVVLQQTLPESVRLQDTSAVHAAENRTLRWEHEGLRPKDQWNIPIVVVPTQQGQVRLPATLSVGNSVSSQTLVQTPDIKLVMSCRPAAKYKKYHQIVFELTNTGEVPLHNLLMDIHLTGNLWHRFGQNFEFFHEVLEVGETHEALLHVKTEELGGAQLQATLGTDEGAQASAGCQFTIVGDGELRPDVLPARPADEPATESTEPSKPREWKKRPDSEPRVVPDAPDPFTLPASPKPSVNPISQPKPREELPVEKPAGTEATPEKEPKPADDFPGFPGALEPLPEREPVVPPKEPLEPESTKESPFDLPPEKSEEPETPAEDSIGPVEPAEDPFAPKKEPDFFDE